MLRRLGIRGKVLAALSVPVLVILALAGQVSLAAIDGAQTARTVQSLLRVLQQSREVVTALQEERAAALPFVNPITAAPDRAAVDASRENTQQAIVQLRDVAADVDFDSLDVEVLGSYQSTIAILESLEDVHGRVDAQNVPISSILANYTRITEEVAAFPAAAADALDDRRLAGIISAHADVVQLTDDYREEQVLGIEVLGGTRERDEVLSFASMFPQTKTSHARTGDSVRGLDIEGVLLPPLGASFNGFQAYDSYRTLLSTGENQNFDFILPADWSLAADEEIAAFEPLQSELRQAATARADAVAADTFRSALITSGVALAALIFSVIIALSIARQIVNPLRRLTEAAANVRDELPNLVNQVAIPGQGPDLTLTQIPVTSRDEIGQLAAAFNEVNSTTIAVAQEQAALRGSIAEMFVNVARRDQILLNRQLSFIDALERSEEDPKTLADLFRLDHLATRMRRNAESLLVLAGIDTGRRLRDAIPLSDVIRTASSEIEHYERVQLDLPIDPMMLGHTGLPAAHMMAELLENATVFSEPGTPVQVSTGIDETDVLITILDQGLGMTPEELADANRKIKTTSAGDVLGSQRLGMFVVGRIALRLGAKVELSLGTGGKGTLATIRMPRVLFLDPSAIPLTAPSRPAAAPETFVLMDEAAEVVHDAAYAPVPTGVQDVSAGALGSAENPAEAVDLEELTDGTTGLGLPRRRNRGADADAPAPSLSHRDADDAAAAPSIPLAPSADALAGAAATPQQEAWAPPVIQESKPLSARRAADDAAPAAPSGAPSEPAMPTRQPATGGLPVRGGGGLPTRQPAAPVGPEPRPTTGPVTQAAPEGRAAMFSGFRSRRAELAAAAIHVDSGENAGSDNEPVTEGDGADRLAAAAAGAAAFFGRGDATPAPMVIPGLVDDDDEYGTAEVFAELAPVDVQADEAQPWQPVQADEAQPWQPVHADEAEPWQPVQAEPAAEAWAPTQPETVQPWQPAQPEPVAEAWAPTQPETVQPWQPAQPEPVAEAWAPTQPEAVQPWQPAQPEPVAEAWAPTQPEPVVAEHPWEQAQPEPAVAEPVVAEHPWAQAQPAAAEPAVAEQWSQEEPQAEQPVAEQPWFLEEPQAEQPVAEQPWFQEEPQVPAPVAQADEQWIPPVQPAPIATPDFATLVQGPSRRDVREPKRRRSLFGRKPKPVQAAAAPVAPPVPAPVPVAPPQELVAPMRQSAWGSNDAPGAHTMEPVAAAPAPFEPVPTFEPVAQSWPAPQLEQPAPFEPAPFEPAPFEPVAFEQPAVAQPAAFTPEPVQPAGPGGAQEPWEPAAPTWQGSAAAALADASSGQAWAPTPAWSSQPPAPEQAAPEAPAPLAARTPVVPTPHQPFRPQTTFTPEPTSGSFDDEVTNMLAQRADIAQQALAELSQLSSYRPAVASGSSTLVRRTPGNIPAAPEIKLAPVGQRVERDANQVRSLLSNFQSGTSRGRQAADTPEGAQTPDGANPGGNEDGSDVRRGEPVTTPDTDLNQRDTSW